jgi:phenylacetate-CoA oxygenase PaaJ subunit
MRSEVEQQVWDEMSKVQDPEIPVLSLVDLKIIRQVEAERRRARVVLTPTFAGCPALEAMKKEIKERLTSAGFSDVTVDVDFSGRWSTDMLEDSAREKLRSFGIAPPVPMSKNGEASRDLARALAEPVQCRTAARRRPDSKASSAQASAARYSTVTLADSHLTASSRFDHAELHAKASSVNVLNFSLPFLLSD